MNSDQIKLANAENVHALLASAQSDLKHIRSINRNLGEANSRLRNELCEKAEKSLADWATIQRLEKETRELRQEIAQMDAWIGDDHNGPFA